MSFVVLPSAPPGALSGSFEVSETRVTDGLGSTVSFEVSVALTVTYLWFGGQSSFGATDTESEGGLESAHT